VSRYSASPTAMGRTPLEGLVMAKRQVTARTHVIQGGMWLLVIWKQSWNNWGNPFFWVNFFSKVLKNIPKWPLANRWGMHWNANLKESKKKIEVLIWFVVF